MKKGLLCCIELGSRSNYGKDKLAEEQHVCRTQSEKQVESLLLGLVTADTDGRLLWVD